MIKLCAFADEYSSKLDEQIAVLKKHNIRYIEIRNVDGKNVAELTEREARQSFEKLKKSGIEVWSVGSPLGKTDIQCNFDEYLKTVEHVCKLANIFQTQRVRIFSFFNAYQQSEKVFGYLNRMTEVAQKFGVVLCHENEKDIYGDTAERVLEIYKNVAGIKLVFDPANYIQCNQDVSAALDLLMDKTCYYHVKDVVQGSGEYVPAGFGSGQFNKILGKIDKDVVMTLEPHLAEFDGYNDIDGTEMKHKFVFADKKQAFEFAVTSFKKYLVTNGYVEKDGSYQKDERVVKFGIIGLGNMGSAHIENFFKPFNISCAKVTAIADLKEDKVNRICKKYPDQKFQVYKSGEELIEKADVDVVLVAIPHYGHPAMCIKALKKGLNVICEKPAGVYTKQVKEMMEVAKQSKGLFTMMFNQRTNCVYRKTRELIMDGKIGTIKRINWIITDWYSAQCYYDSGDWRATWAGEGGGVLCNQSPHQLDLLQWVTGLMPNKVHAFCHFGKWHNIEVEDDVTAYLEYPNGATGVFITSTGDAPGTNRFEVLGTKGKIVIEKNVLTLTLNDVDERVFNTEYKGGFGSPKTTTIQVQTDGQNPQHIGICRNFANAVLGKEQLFVDGQEGLKGVQLMNAMLLSTWLNKAVDLPFDDDLYFAELQKRIDGSTVKKQVVEQVFDTTNSFNKNN